MPYNPKPQFSQLINGSAIVRFGWFEGIDLVSLVFYDNTDCHGTETMSREAGRRYWKQLLKAGYKVVKNHPVELDDQLALSQAYESKDYDYSNSERFLAS